MQHANDYQPPASQPVVNVIRIAGKDKLAWAPRAGKPAEARLLSEFSDSSVNVIDDTESSTGVVGYEISDDIEQVP
jgi:hypothetical protein